MKPSLPSLHTQLIALRARNSLDRGNDCVPCCERFVQTCFPWTLNAAALNTLIEVNELQRKNSSHGNEVLSQDSMHLIQKPCYQRRSPCQDPAGNRTTRRPDHREETQTEVVWTCLPFIRSGQNLLASHSERGTKTRQTEEEVGRLHQGMDRPGVRRVP